MILFKRIGWKTLSLNFLILKYAISLHTRARFSYLETAVIQELPDIVLSDSFR
jgi:hypothetical protein